jgi:hypothetical protein
MYCATTSRPERRASGCAGPGTLHPAMQRTWNAMKALTSPLFADTGVV